MTKVNSISFHDTCSLILLLADCYWLMTLNKVFPSKFLAKNTYFILKQISLKTLMSSYSGLKSDSKDWQSSWTSFGHMTCKIDRMNFTFRISSFFKVQSLWPANYSVWSFLTQDSPKASRNCCFLVKLAFLSIFWPWMSEIMVLM